MIKKFSAVLLCICLISGCLAACSSGSSETADTAGGLEDGIVEYGFEVDEDGNTVAVVYEDGKAYVLDAEGNKTDQVIKDPKNMPDDSKDSGSDSTENSVEPNTSPERVSDRNDDEISNNTGGTGSSSGNAGNSGNSGSGGSNSGSEGGGSNSGSGSAPEDETVAGQIGTTGSELTTLSIDEDEVPSTSATGDPVAFSDEDVVTLTHMLEVPYLYLASYENTQNVPINIATHVACWMLERENLDTNNFASGTVVIDLFNYFARTVVSFKPKCNEYTADDVDNAAPIRYNSNNDTFTVTGDSYESRTHIVNIIQIQDLGNNNYYKVIAEVSGIDSSCKVSSVVAVVQKNKLDTTLGFSIKALKWN